MINRAARPVPYGIRTPIQSTYASRTMMMTGIIVLAFVVWHLLHLTLGVTHPSHSVLRDAHDRHDVHAMVVKGFQEPLVTLSYVVAMGALGLHLLHGAQSFFQSLGWYHRRTRRFLAGLFGGLAVLIIAGNVLMPLLIFLGVYPGGGTTP